MRYHYQQGNINVDFYECNHPLYSICTLFMNENIGLAVVQLRFSKSTKMAFYTAVDSDLISAIGVHDGLPDYIQKHGSKMDENGMFPTVDVRKIMWALRIKPLPKNEWEKGLK